MGGVFDRLHKKLEVDKREEGISALEIASLPPNLRKVMKVMLREVQMTYQELCLFIEQQSERDRLTGPELDEALEMLTRQGWLIRRGEGERINYQVNLRRKAASKIAQGIWSSLDARIAQANPPEPPEDVQ